MTVWLSGFVFLVSCQFAQGATSAENHCPLTAGRKVEKHCDKGDNKDLATVSFPSGASFDCCGLLPTLFDKARKIEQGERTAAPLLVATIKLVDRGESGFAISALAGYSSPVTYRNKIFIRNRILRI